MQDAPATLQPMEPKGFAGRRRALECIIFLSAMLSLAMSKPAWAQVTLGAPDAEAGFFGEPVVIDGDVAVVGAVNTSSSAGAAYVFRRAAGVWSSEAKLVADDARPEDWFGHATVDGDTIVVGAMDADTDAGAEAGAAYVFEWRGGVWTQTQKLEASDASAADGFGAHVVLEGDTLVISSLFTDELAGAVYVFEEVGGTWVEQQKLTAAIRLDRALYGRSLALEGDRLVVGAVGDAVRFDSGAVRVRDAGVAYVYERDASGVWSEVATLAAPDAATDDSFGLDVELSGGTILVGAFADGPGSAHGFELVDGAWVHRQALRPPPPAADFDSFGQAVALEGDVALVGAPGWNGYRGSVFRYRRIGSSWSDDGRFEPSGLPPGAQLGGSVDIEGTMAMAGAPGDDEVHVFELSDPPPLRLVVDALPDGVVGEPYRYRLEVTGGSAARVDLAFSATGLPPGLSLSEDGAIEGTPTLATGSAGVTVRLAVEAPSGEVDRTERQLVVIGPSLGIVTEALPAAELGRPYAARLEARGAVGDVTFRAPAPDALPPGIALDAEGRLSGVPVELGTFTFDVEASDAPPFGGMPSIASATLTLEVMGQPLEIVAAPPRTFVAGESFEFDVRTTGGVPPYVWTVLPSSSLADGVNTRGEAGALVVSGRVEDAAELMLDVAVRDAIAAEDQATIEVIIEAPDDSCDPRDPACPAGPVGNFAEASSDCSCRAANLGASDGSWGVAALLGLGLIVIRRRPRRVEATAALRRRKRSAHRHPERRR